MMTCIEETRAKVAATLFGTMQEETAAALSITEPEDSQHAILRSKRCKLNGVASQFKFSVHDPKRTLRTFPLKGWVSLLAPPAQDRPAPLRSP